MYAPSGILAASEIDTTATVSLIGLTDDGVVSVTDIPQGISATVVDPVAQMPWDTVHIRFEVSNSVPLGQHTITLIAETGREALDVPMDILVVDEIHRTLLPLINVGQ